jgi:hypothetical protein
MRTSVIETTAIAPPLRGAANSTSVDADWEAAAPTSLAPHVAFGLATCTLISSLAFPAVPLHGAETALAMQRAKPEWLWGTPFDLPRRVTSTNAELEHALLEIAKEPVESGVTHPAEQYLERFLGSYGADSLRAWVYERGDASPSRAADILRLLGRTSAVPHAHRIALVSKGLESRNVAVRDAAIEAAEQWADPFLLTLLLAHDEPVPWVREYLGQVIADLRP